MITVTSRTAARALMYLAGAAMITAGMAVLVTGQVPSWEIWVAPPAICVYVVAWLWLRREKRHGSSS